MQLFWRSPAAWKVAVRWATATGDASDPLRRLAAFFMVGRLADATVGAATDADFALRPAVAGVLERLPAGVADEVRWQIEYLP